MRRRFSLLLLLATLTAQPPVIHDLFPREVNCRPTFKEVQVGKIKYQVFTDARSGVEQFRVAANTWNYGVKHCGDFNRDGVRDYAWYGGDDTSQAHYLILSKRTGYRIIDIEKTFEAEWRRKRGGKAPDLALLHESFLRTVTLRWTPNKQVLLATDGRIQMEVEDQHWVNLR